MLNSETLVKNERATNDFLSFVASGVYHTKIVFVGAYFVDTPEVGNNAWVLVDTGLPFSHGKIEKGAQSRYGAQKPSAIVLTHGHFDHAGAALALASEWNVPIFAHRLEMPYLTGKSDYPPQDSSMGGAIAQMARFFPHSGYDFGERVVMIPENGEIHEMPNWKFLHTPGHTAGHISLWRERDRTLIAGDALTTMNLDSWTSQITEKQEFCRPASPFTTDWQAARRSVELLADLEPNVVGAGHGEPITGADTAQRLKEFARNFKPPARGRYVEAPAICDESGVLNVPPPVTDYYKIAAGTLAAGVLITTLARRGSKKREDQFRG
ncbi:MAG: MBL fold metallo-hydrolase [Acidobacteria bacterium]|jgi:glyoxylase-like metal-dependent hydrolase (beta-lactamase superfamily II)|nr:MBL fold metallo-hydrolase [Acidobacteriota bacterium]